MDKLKELSEKYDKQLLAIQKIADENNPLRVKAQFISCSKCKSKLAKEYLKRIGVSCKCPVCTASLYSKTAQERIDKARERLDKIRDEIDAEKKKSYKKQKQEKKSKDKSSAFQDGLNEAYEMLETVYREIKTPDFVELHGETGGDVRCLRVYNDGSICEK